MNYPILGTDSLRIAPSRVDGFRRANKKVIDYL